MVTSIGPTPTTPRVALRLRMLDDGGGVDDHAIIDVGLSVDDGLCADEDAAAANGLLESGRADAIIPVDVITAPDFSERSPATTCEQSSVPNNQLILDIGPATAKKYSEVISAAKTLIWNGPMGVFEWQAFAAGSEAVARAVAANKMATSVIGGGSTAEIVGSLGLVDQITHVSTGGGASLEFLEGKILPGVAALDDAP